MVNQVPPRSLVTLAIEIASQHNLEPALVCAVVEQESGWNPHAVRFEPQFERRYIRPALPNLPTTEELCLAISWGLMQVMGETAREHDYSDPYLTALCVPQIGLEVGCRVLSSKITAAGKDILKALLLWNGGGDPTYPSRVLARRPRYIQS